MTYEVDDDQYPASTGVYIEATWNGFGTYTGSGVLVGRNDILTAAHVIYNDRRGGLADDIKLFPSYDPDARNNATVAWSTVHYFPDFDPDGNGRFFPGDFNSGTVGETEIDIALFTLSEAAGERYGWMGIDFNFGGGNVGVFGHPGVYGTQPMYDTGSIRLAPFNDAAFIYDPNIEVNPGNSGGPVFYDYGDGAYVVGLVSTAGAAVNVGGHESWLRDYMRDNDVAIGGSTFDPIVTSPPTAEDPVDLSDLVDMRQLIDFTFGSFADPELIQEIKDYGGRTFGNANAWKWIGIADVQGDGDIEYIFVNRFEERWATIGPNEELYVDFDDHGRNGDTRVVGLYVDPLVENGTVARFSGADSQQRFQNDLRNDNFSRVLGWDDFDGDGVQEVYLDTASNGAVLRMLMHSDGNIRYANYQSEADLAQYMGQNQVSSDIWSDWFLV